jgi:AbrB family looped-hinge helix DNA binding protein
MAVVKHELAGEVKISARGAVNLPAKLLRELGWNHGDHVLIDVDAEDRVVLTRKPASLADALAGRLTHLFPGGEDTRRFLDEERASWD